MAFFEGRPLFFSSFCWPGFDSRRDLESPNSRRKIAHLAFGRSCNVELSTIMFSTLGDDEEKKLEKASGLSAMPSCAVRITNRTKCPTCLLLPVG